MKKIKGFSHYYVDKKGIVYHKDKTPVKMFHSCGYLQVYMRDDNNKRHVYGAHQVVAMAYLDYFPGCVVHHIDGDKHNNRLENLSVTNRSDHAKFHADATKLNEYNKMHRPPNKGKKMSAEFRQHCRDDALLRCAKKKSNKE